MLPGTRSRIRYGFLIEGKISLLHGPVEQSTQNSEHWKNA